VDFDDLLKALLKRENRQVCRWLGVIVASPFLLGILAGIQLPEKALRGWFAEWFVGVIGLMGWVGMLLFLLSFDRSRQDKACHRDDSAAPPTAGNVSDQQRGWEEHRRSKDE
jgi:uncharacterized membrane protein YeaQ/YmgE (transglycosylase-associated protein family)